MKRAKTSVKIAIASALAISSTAAIINAAPKILNAINSASSDSSLYLDVEKVDNDTIKVALDNIEDIAKALQFSIKLDENVKLKDGEAGIRDLISKEVETRISNDVYSGSNSIFTDYTYNEDSNTIDILITAENYLPKVGNKIEIFELDIVSRDESVEKLSEVSVTPVDESNYKYVSNSNKEYIGLGVEYENNAISLNTAPTITYSGVEAIDIFEGDKIVFDEIEGIETNDIDGDTVILEVRNITGIEESKEDVQPVITEFASNDVGSYTFKVYAVDGNGAKSTPVNILVNVSYNLELDAPTITGADNVIIQSGDIFKPLDGVKATDAKGVELTVNVSGELNTGPDQDTDYTLTYSATDKYGKATAVDRIVTVIANQAPVISGVNDAVINIGDKFDPMDGVTVSDDKDSDLKDKVVVTGIVNTLVAREYKLSYSVEDSGKKVGRAQRTVRVNRAPVVSGYDSDIVIKVGTPLTKEMILGGVTITDETDYTVEVTIPIVNSEGTYEATITVTDADGGKTSVKRKIVFEAVDTEAPKFDYTGKTNIEINKGDSYELPVVSATDNVDGTIDVIRVITKDGVEVSQVDTNELGTYIITYTATDKAGNEAKLEIKVVVKEAEKPGESVDNEAPKFDYTGQTSIELKIGSEYDIPVVTATDNVDGTVDVIRVITKDGVEVSQVDTNELGIYIITYTAKDKAGNKSTLVIEVVVKIEINVDNIDVGNGNGTEDSPLELKVQENATIQNINELINSISKTHDYEFIGQPKVIGENKIYTLKLTKKTNIFAKIFRISGKESYIEIIVQTSNNDVLDMLDKLYNSTITPPIIPDKVAPVFNYSGNKIVVVENGASYEPPTVTATDDVDGIVTVDRIITRDDVEVNKIDTSKAGIYMVTYTAKDKAGNKAELVIRVTVLELDSSNPDNGGNSGVTPDTPNDEDNLLPDNGGDSDVTPDEENSQPDNGGDSEVTPDTPNDEQNSSQNNGIESGDNNDLDLPKTGGISAVALATVGVILASTGVILTKMKKKREK